LLAACWGNLSELRGVVGLCYRKGAMKSLEDGIALVEAPRIDES